MAALAQFEVRKILRMDSYDPVPLILFAGLILDGTVRAGMTITFELHRRQSVRREILGIEYVDYVSADETLIGLLCAENDPDEAELYSDCCPAGTILEINA
jgi:hypothetical protein